MSVKTSISISEQQDRFARALVEQGRFSSVSAVVQHGLELLREETELKQAEIKALRQLLHQRAEGEFVSNEEGRTQTEAMLERKRKSLGV